MKNTSLKFILLMSMFFSTPVHGMSCTINTINTTVNQILSIVSELIETGIDVNVSGLDDIILQISLLGDVLESELNVIESKIDELSSSAVCMIISTPTTITQPGSYCLNADISGTITIDASDVTLNLDGYQVTMGITITSGNNTISILNGTVVGGSPGILVQSGCQNISIQSVLIKNATSGILFENVSGGSVEHCTLTANMTGLSLINSSNIAVFDTVASANMYAGFDLVGSCTNSFIECKALATGQGNTIVYNNVVTGFSSINGYGNIFERCIANATQALSTTDSNSLVAGFALQGTESCTKIINSESANAVASSNGVTVPYGIILQETFNSLQSVVVENLGNDSFSINWSPNGQYLAIGGESISGGYQNSNYNFQIFQFDRINNSLTALAGAISAGSPQVSSVNWSPDGQYVAIGGTNITDGYENVGYQFQIFQFSATNNSLLPIAGAISAGSPPIVSSVDWSSDGQYVAVGGYGISDGYENAGYQVQIFQFDRIANTLMPIAGELNAGGDYIFSVNWSPDGQYLAIGGGPIADGYGPGDKFQIFQFNRSNNNLTPVAGDMNGDALVRSVTWSPDGEYIAIGGYTLPGDKFQIYQFNRSTNSLGTPVAGAFTSNIEIDSVHWSPDGQFIAVVGTMDPGFQLFQFNRSDNNLLSIAGANSGDVLNYFNNLVNWSPDGQYIALSDANAAAVVIFTGLQFPSQNVISDNTVYCNGQSISNPYVGAVGVGISGTSICNMITGNTAYNNPPVSSNFFVPSNYCFATNVFNQAFGQGPTALQNISLNACDPIIAPVDIGLLAQQILYNITGPIPSQLDALEAAILTAIDTANPCGSTVITSGTTITAAGNYCVAQSMTGNIVVNASDVDLNLNNRTVTGTITINSDLSSVAISNGMVNANGGANGILVNAGSSNISIENVTVKNAITGIDFVSASDATVAQCTLTLNTTGMQLNSSYGINVVDTVASANTHAGFDLISSFTNSFINCKALSTGQGNTVAHNNVVTGFSSINGYGNIFERCIANATQALSTTDSNSLVAGFALQGTESCSKIINCESANASASSNGATMPYGIVLDASLEFINPLVGAFEEYETVHSLRWSPDGQYVAVAGSLTLGQIQILSFDRVSNMLTVVAIWAAAQFNPFTSIDWSPDGQYFVATSTNTDNYITIFHFNRVDNSLEVVANANLAIAPNVYSAAWSPDGNYIAAVGQHFVSNYDVVIFKFDSVQNSLTQVASTPVAVDLTDMSVDWSPNGQYLAVGVALSVTGVPGPYGALQIFNFNVSTNQLSSIGTYLNGNSLSSVEWSPDGNYLAVSGIMEEALEATTAFGVYIFRINSNETLTLTDQILQLPTPSFPHADNLFVYEINWSSDGQYLLLCGEDLGDIDSGLYVYGFDSNLGILNPLMGSVFSGEGYSIYSAQWSPDGGNIAMGGYAISDGLGTDFQVLSGLTFPTQNVISDNTVYCNGHTVFNPYIGATGVGISGTSICNMIIGNMAYNNPPISENNFVPSNYYFVTNVFNQALVRGQRR